MTSASAADGLMEIPARALRPGMYVAAIDRPWTETPFALQGFNVCTPQDVDMVCHYCTTVQVDPRRQVAVAPERAPRATRPMPKGSLELLPEEFAQARLNLDSADTAICKVFDQLKRGGRLEIDALRSAVDPLVKGVLSHSEAMAALLRIRRRGEYLYNHSLCNAVWSAVLGRHLGLQPDVLGDLALGAALVDVGMTRLEWDPQLKPAALSAAEVKAVRSHVELGVGLIRSSGGVDDAVIDVVRCHHERFDGSGYPHGLHGMDIPMLARVAGLVDAYDAMITPRPHAPRRTSFEAMQELWDNHGAQFQRELVEQFIQAVGLFPTGALVELSSGEVGIVVEQSETRRLRPKVMVVLDASKRRRQSLAILDLNGPDAGSDLWIRAELPAGAHGVHADEYFL